MSATSNLVLDQQHVAHVSAGLSRIILLSSSISALSTVVDIATTIKEAETCDQCAGAHKKLLSGYTLAGVNVAIDTLGLEISYQAERMEELIYSLGTEGGPE